MATVNIRTKGQNGEREIADALNGIIYLVHQQAGMPFPPKPIVQRNQNQSAVGGADLTGTGKYVIEVKRHENLAINTWWKQCETSAKELNGIPVLIYRQSRQPWTVVMPGFYTYNAGNNAMQFRSTILFDDFCKLFKADYELRLAESDEYRNFMESKTSEVEA